MKVLSVLIYEFPKIIDVTHFRGPSSPKSGYNKPEKGKIKTLESCLAKYLIKNK